MIFAEESYAINGACMDVYRTLGNGFLESVYQECLELEFAQRRIPYVPQPALTLQYQGRTLNQTFRPDFVCYSKIIVELKAVSKIAPEHRAQVTNYLKATGFELGIICNFGHYPLLEIVRIPRLKALNPQ